MLILFEKCKEKKLTCMFLEGIRKKIIPYSVSRIIWVPFFIMLWDIDYGLVRGFRPLKSSICKHNYLSLTPDPQWKRRTDFFPASVLWRHTSTSTVTHAHTTHTHRHIALLITIKIIKSSLLSNDCNHILKIVQIQGKEYYSVCSYLYI